MRGVILAAGKGARLNGGTGVEPKCLMRLGGRTLIERQIAALRSVSIDNITVVVGFGADRVRAVCGDAVQYVENAIFDRTNSMYSLWLARDLLRDGFVVMNADVLFHPRLLRVLINAPEEAALLVCYREVGSPALGEEEMKVRVEDGRVTDISKEMDGRLADGENVGIGKFGPFAARLLVEEMRRLVEAGELRAWAPRAFRELAVKQPLYAIGTRGYPWIEIDFPEDYQRAAKETLPHIMALGGELLDESACVAAGAAD